MTRLIVTDDVTYEQRLGNGTTNSGAPFTEVREVQYVTDPVNQYIGITFWQLLDPEQAEPRAGDRWLLRTTNSKYTLTDVVNDVIGDLP